MLKHLQTRPYSASRHKQHTHSPAGQHRPFLIPPAPRREGRKFSAGIVHAPAGRVGAAPPEPPGLTPDPGSAPERHGTRRAPRASRRALQPAPAAGAVGNKNSGEEGGGDPPETPPRRGQRGRASLSPRGATGAAGLGAASRGAARPKAPLPAEAPFCPAWHTGMPPVAGGAVGRAQRAAPRTSRGEAQVAPAPRGRPLPAGEAPRKAALQGAVFGRAGEEESGCPPPRWLRGEGSRAQTAPAGRTGAGGGHGGEARRAPGSRCMQAGTAARAPAEGRTKLARLSRRTAPVVRPGGGAPAGACRQGGGDDAEEG